jgi:hypothetical protein
VAKATDHKRTLDGPAIGRRYVGDLGKQYYGWQDASAREGAIRIVPYFKPYVREADRLIDFGCGGGFLLELLQAREKVGIDPTAEVRNDAAAGGLRVVASPVDLSDRSADVVISNHALEHAVHPLDT